MFKYLVLTFTADHVRDDLVICLICITCPKTGTNLWKMAATAVFVLSLVLSTYGFLLDNAPSSSQSDLFNSQYTGNGESK